MHELSIALSIIEMAQEEAERRGVAVDAVYLDLGLLAGVVPEALLFSYQVASAETPLEGSRLIIRQVPIEIFCNVCGVRRIISSMQWMHCPECDTPAQEIIHGKELTITALEVRDDCRTAYVGPQ